jgi:hypothetical protein
MARHRKPIVFSNPLEWGPPEAFALAPAERRDGAWYVERGLCGSRGTLVSTAADRSTPELSFDPGLSGWHDVRVRVFHGMNRDSGGVYAGTSRDRALRLLRPELSTTDFETLSLGPRDMTGARMRLDGSYCNCWLDSVEFAPCETPTPLPPAEKELCAVLDFADAPDDYRPMGRCAAECVRVHAEAGFTTIFWKTYKTVCEYHTRVGQVRWNPAGERISVGKLLELYDTLDAAVAEAKACGLRILAWFRLTNEVSKKNEVGGMFEAVTPFHRAHPEMRMRYKTGELSPRLSFAFPEVRDYYAALAREVLDRGMDGLMIDVLRHPPMAQYDKPLVDAFIARTGRDPMKMDGDGDEEWLRFKATAFTHMLRDFRRMMASSGHSAKPIYVRTMPQLWFNKKAGCDIDAWLREGLVDTVVAGHHCITSPGHVWQFDLKPLVDLMTGRARLVAQVMRGCEMPTAFELARQAFRLGAAGTAIYESNVEVTLPSKRDAFRRLRNARLRP